MAKRRLDGPQGIPGNGRIRFILVEMEGTNESIQQGIRAMAQAMSRGTPPARQLIDAKAREEHSDDDALMDQDESLADSLAADVDDTQVEQEASTSRRKRGEGPSRDRNEGIAISPTLNLRPEGKPPLAQFVESKAPSLQQEEVAVFVYYLKEIAQVEKCTIDDVFTCYKNLSLKIPKDLRQTIRNI